MKTTQTNGHQENTKAALGIGLATVAGAAAGALAATMVTNKDIRKKTVKAVNMAKNKAVDYMEKINAKTDVVGAVVSDEAMKAGAHVKERLSEDSEKKGEK
jgi:hypothetical protein